MKLTFEGHNIHEIITAMRSTLQVIAMGQNIPPLPQPEDPQGPGPETQTPGVPPANHPVDNPVANPVENTKQAKPKIDRVAAMNKARAAKDAKKAAAAGKPTDELGKSMDELMEAAAKQQAKAAEPVDPVEAVRIRQKTVEDLQSAYANGRQKEVFELLSRFGNGAKSFRELPPDAFVPIRQAIDNGALT
jgi:hypothetical protein